MGSRVFSPNLTSYLLVESAIQEVKEFMDKKYKLKLLDLGSGGGHIGVQVAKSLGLSEIWSSDLDVVTLDVAAQIAKAMDLKINHRIGDLFSPWEGEKFDLIIDDVSGVAHSIAKISPWFRDVPCSSGECGTLLIQRVLQEANRHLTNKGRIIFPIISLSAGDRIISVARKHFKNLKQLQRKQWPLPESMMEFKYLLGKQKENRNIDYEEKFGMIICYTEIYVAYN